MNALRRCPFCGGTKLAAGTSDLAIFVFCMSCGARGPHRNRQMGGPILFANREWNRRAKCGSCAAFKAHRTMRKKGA